MRVYEHRVYPRIHSVHSKQPNGLIMTSTSARILPTTVQPSDVARELTALLPIVIVAKALCEIFAGKASFAPSLLSPSGR